ncbi:MAG: hypothetical protein D6766_02000 [Verrucomicrobia bacterium]|nr:MAG: hypothetical protein D6766_02000 [Verrucomicrobiota bacterium]
MLHAVAFLTVAQDTTSSPAQVLRSTWEELARIRSARFAAVWTIRGRLPTGTMVTTRVDYVFVGEGTRFKVALEQHPPPGVTGAVWQVVYDGSRHSALERRAGLLLTRQQPPEGDMRLLPNPLLLPLEWLSKRSDACPGCYLQLTDLYQEQRLEALCKNAQWEDRDRPDMTIRIPGTGLVLDGESFDFLIQYDKRKRWPLRIVRAGHIRRMITETKLMYQEGGGSPPVAWRGIHRSFDATGRLMADWSYELRDVEINPQIAASEFQLDTNAVRTVWDDDRRLFLQTSSGYTGPGPRDLRRTALIVLVAVNVGLLAVVAWLLRCRRS